MIDTERLHLRRHRMDDFPACTAMWANPLVTKYIGGKPATGEETWARMLRYAGHWAMLGFGYWAVLERSTGRLVGELGFADGRRDIVPPLPVPELGWALAASAHGKGYATEAVRAALAWGDLRWSSTTCLIGLANVPSMRVADKCGFREQTRTTYQGEAMMILARPRS